MDVRQEKRIAATSDIGPYGCVASVRWGRVTARVAPTKGLPIEFRRGRCLHRPARAYTAPLVNGVIAKPVRTLAVAIRSPRPLCSGITDSHSQCADWSRNDTQVLSASVIARAQGTRGNPSPVPSAPLPKGGWHGEAVTGGFHTSPHLL